jgi:hypothetical protein
MILISIYPFAFKKLFLLVLAFLCVSSAFCLADSLFMARQYASQQHRATFSPFRPSDMSDSARLVVAASFEREARCEEAQFATYPTNDDSTAARATVSWRACILNSSQRWAYSRSAAIRPVGESFLSTAPGQPIFPF